MLGIVQARMGSSRLPGKILSPLAGRSVLGWVVRAVRASGALDDLVIATGRSPADDVVEAEAARLGVACHRGPEDDVLTRFLGALDARQATAPGIDAVMRFTADCPLLDPAIIKRAVAIYRADPELDYLSTGLPHTLPRGLDVEIVSARALKGLDPVATGHHRAHVTSYIYSNADAYRILGITFPPDAAHLRATLDTPEDLRLIEAVVAKFGDTPIPYRELVEWLDLNPEVRAINAAVRQKELDEG